jgi:long-chain acyl-CoA synthetase
MGLQEDVKAEVSAESVARAASMCELFQATAAVHADQPALRTPGGATVITWRQYAQRVRAIAAGLAAIGVRRGDTVGIMLTNRPEFHLVDTAAFHLGATPFSIYNTNSVDQIAYLFSNAENTVVVCERQFLDKVFAAARGSRVTHVICVDGPAEDVTTLDALETGGDPGFDFEQVWRSVGPDDVLTLIYTSGTTGPPKAVELTHRNLLHSVAAGLEIFDLTGGRLMSYLPDAHIANRWLSHYAAIASGATTTTVADAKDLVVALPETRPTAFLAVPALWYKIKAALERAVTEQRGPRRAVATWALKAGTDLVDARMAGTPPTRALRLRHAVADRVVLSKLRARIGLDRATIAVTGAAPIAPEALRFILALGIPVCEGWGMSEISALGTLTRPDDIRIGSVGRAARGVELAVAEDGELLVHGSTVMRGYRNDPERTAETVDEQGWLHTGDIGSIDVDGFVRVIDRKKELIINAAGKNMSPSNIENTVKVACPAIGSVIAVGDNRPYVVALITLDPDAAAGLSNAGTSAKVLAADPDVLAAVEAGVLAANARLSRVEQIKRFTVLPTYWEPGGDELTPTLKLRRKPITTKYATEIDALYQ